MIQPVRFRRIKVSVTLAGWLYIAVTLLVGAAAVNTANNLLYLVTAGLLAPMALSGFVAYPHSGSWTSRWCCPGSGSPARRPPYAWGC